MDILIRRDDMDLLRRNILPALDPDLSEVLEKAVPRDDGYLLTFSGEDQAETFIDVVMEESEISLDDPPAAFDDLMDRMEAQVDQGGV